MDMNNLMAAISSVGFPIVACGFLGYYIYKLQTKTNDIIMENTKVLTELVTIIKEFMDKEGGK